jgi:hypothetical protein
MDVTVPFPLRQTGKNTLFLNIIFRHPNSFQSLFPKNQICFRSSVCAYHVVSPKRCVVGKVYTYGNVPHWQRTLWNLIDFFCFGNQRQLSINIDNFSHQNGSSCFLIRYIWNSLLNFSMWTKKQRRAQNAIWHTKCVYIIAISSHGASEPPVTVY